MLEDILFYINERIKYLKKHHRLLQVRELELLKKGILEMLEDE